MSSVNIKCNTTECNVIANPNMNGLCLNCYDRKYKKGDFKK